MSYKDVLVYVEPNKAMPVCLDLASAIAAAHSAHLAGLHVMSYPAVPMDISGPVPVQLIEWQEDYVRQKAEKARELAQAAERRSGHPIEWRCVKGDIFETALLHARYADLTVVTQEAKEDDYGPADALAETMVMGSGRPVLVVPHYGKFATVGERVLVAWKRTREAARAVHDALPFLVRAKSVTIMEINPDEGEDRHVAGADIATHLARHGVKAVVSPTTTEIDVGDTILSRAADLGSDLIVMGAYGHSRLREFALGGASRHLLANMTVPVLMSH